MWALGPMVMSELNESGEPGGLDESGDPSRGTIRDVLGCRQRTQQRGWAEDVSPGAGEVANQLQSRFVPRSRRGQKPRLILAEFRKKCNSRERLG